MTKIYVCGDIINMFSNRQFIAENLIENIKSADYAVCNFEGTLPFLGCKSRDMVQDPSTLTSLKDAGFDMLLLANNHVTDYGEKGLRFTIEEIDKHKFIHIGAGFSYEETYKPYITTINGINFGFINLCEAQIGHYEDEKQNFGYAWIGDVLNEKRIKELKKTVNYLILFVHAGLEKYTLPLEQFRKLYRQYCDWGVDCIVGGHPHVAQGIEKYKESYIFYSLGNFYFPLANNDEDVLWNNSYSLILSFEDGCVSYKIIKHSTNKLKVYLNDNSPIDVNDLSRRLCYPVYERELGEQNERAFNSIVMRLYREALNGPSENDTIIKKIRFIYNYLFDKRSKIEIIASYRMQLLRRLTQNETYRFLTISATSKYINRISNAGKYK